MLSLFVTNTAKPEGMACLCNALYRDTCSAFSSQRDFYRYIATSIHRYIETLRLSISNCFKHSIYVA